MNADELPLAGIRVIEHVPTPNPRLIYCTQMMGDWPMCDNVV